MVTCYCNGEFMVTLDEQQRQNFEGAPKLAREWLDAGIFFKWTSTLEENKPFGELNVFSMQKGDVKNPAILLIHGYPTSSFDFVELFDLLSADHFVCAVDTPGYGFSDKPRKGYTYSLKDDAQLIQYYVTQVLGLQDLCVVTHDKGDSVGLALLELHDHQDGYVINHLIVTNGSIYLPLANLTRFQKVLLSRFTGPIATRFVTGAMLANGLNELTHNVKEPPEKLEANAFILGYQHCGHVQHAVIQYLRERKRTEIRWLENLQRSNIPTILIWGQDDPIASTRIADYVWAHYLKDRAATSEYWIIPKANHYLQNDRPELLNKLIRHSLGEKVECGELNEEERPFRKSS